MFGARAKPETETDPSLWRPVALKDGDPQAFTYLSIEKASASEVAGQIYRWPRINDEGELEFELLGALRAAPIRRRSLVFRGRQLVDLKRGLHVPSRDPLAPGDFIAGSPITDDFWNGSEGIDSWKPFSPPLIRITDEAKEANTAKFEPLAWTLYRDWLGQAPLIAHFARLGREQLNPEGGKPAGLSIEVRVDEDTERFATPEDYLDLASPQALERPDSVLVEAGDPELWVHISIARRQDRERDWLKNAVLLEVGSCDPSRLEDVSRIHKRMAAAVRRGEPKWGAKGSSTSVVGFRPLDESGEQREIPEAFREKAQKRASRTLAGLVGIAGGLVGAASGLGWLWLLAVGAAAGLAIGAIWTLWPGVEFTARRSERIMRFGLKGVLAPLVGAAGAVVIRAFAERGSF
jgi:hypothetical protein